MSEKPRHSKHYSRCCAVQALYQWQHTQDSAEEIIQQFITDGHLQKVDRKYFKKLVTGIIAEQTALDALLLPHLDRDLSTLTPVELAILRLAAYELTQCQELPYKVVINEALEIAKDYGADQSYKYVNAVLDAIAAQTRKLEVSLKKSD
jgi:transcription antitermination protein NusB